jgi:hypothetical protein
MTVAYYRSADGGGATVQNTYRRADGTLHTLDNSYTNAAGVPYIIFRDKLITTQIGASKRLFITTDTRKFTATVVKGDVTMTCRDIDEFCAAKDPTEVLDYTIDYTDVMNESDPPDSIVSSSWSLLLAAPETGLQIDDDSQFTLTTATAWISGGVRTSLEHQLINHITCASGRQYERSITIWLVSK